MSEAVMGNLASPHRDDDLPYRSLVYRREAHCLESNLTKAEVLQVGCVRAHYGSRFSSDRALSN